MAKVYVFLAEGFEEVEALTVVDLLRRAGVEVVMTSVTGHKLVTSVHNITVAADELFEALDYVDADLLVLPGGMPGAKNLYEHSGLQTLLKDFAAKQKKLAAICAAPRVYGMLGLLQGRTATCYPGHEDALLGAKISQEDVAIDANFITSKAMGTAIDFALALIRELQGAEDAKKIAASIHYRHFE